MLLKADPILEGNEADDKADPSVCLKLNQIPVFQYFFETAGSMDHQYMLRQPDFFRSFCLRRPQIIHDVGSLCISTMWLFNFFLVQRTLKQELQVKETSGKRDQGEFDQYDLLHHQAVLHYTLPPLPLHILLIIIILLLLLLILFLLLLFKEVWKASRPSLLSCRDL